MYVIWLIAIDLELVLVCDVCDTRVNGQWIWRIWQRLAMACNGWQWWPHLRGCQDGGSVPSIWRRLPLLSITWKLVCHYPVRHCSRRGSGNMSSGRAHTSHRVVRYTHNRSQASHSLWTHIAFRYQMHYSILLGIAGISIPLASFTSASWVTLRLKNYWRGTEL